MKEWTVGDILATSGAYWRSSMLQTAVRLDLFTRLAAAPQSGKELAGAAGCDPRGLGMLLTALAAAGLLRLEKRAAPSGSAPVGFDLCTGSVYAATETAIRYLSRTSSEYLGFIILHHHHLMPAWSRLDEAVRQGGPIRSASSSDTDEEEEREAFLLGMFNIAVHQAQTVARHLNLSARKRLLDVGGGPGTYAVFFCRENPHLSATIFDKPTTRPYAEKIVDRYGMRDRIDFAGGDFHLQELPHGYDAAWISQILHGGSPDQAADIVAKAARCLNPGGLLCIQEFMLEDNLDGPLHPALFSLNMLVGTQGGQAYTRSELAAMLQNAGARDIRRLEVDLPQNCAVMLAVMPG